MFDLEGDAKLPRTAARRGPTNNAGHPFSVTYNDKTIMHNNKEFVVGDRTFSSLEAAKTFIDEHS